MPDRTRRARVVRSDTGGTSWEVATRAPSAELAPHLLELLGYLEHAPAGLKRREYPIPGVVAILDLGEPIRMRFRDRPGRVEQHRGGFVAGIDTRFVDTEHDGVQHGIQINLKPLAAARAFGVPLSALAEQVVPILELLPRRHRNLSERLRELPSWDARFDLLEGVLLERLRENDREHAVLRWAMERVLRAGGTLEVRALSGELGYSHKHVIELFRSHLGLTPKLLGRLVRFDRLMRALKAGSQEPWAELAVRLGYFDQAHLSRDVREFAGSTPGELRKALSPLAGLFGETAANSAG